MEKFIRVISPFTVIIVLILDIATVAFGAFAVMKIIENADIYTILFVIIEVVALIVAALTTKEALSNGVKFGEKEIEFTALDSDSTFQYAEIDRVDTYKDTQASLRKNFVDRYSRIILYMKDDTVATIDLGQTSKKTLSKIKAEIESRI